MNPQGTSFIPQRPTQGQSPKKIVHKVYVFTYLSYIFFFGTILSVFGIMAYGYLLDTQLEAEKNKLVSEEAKFNDAEIESVKKFDEQLQIATERMNLHLSPLPIFSGLERSVSQLLTLNTFKYTRENDSAPKMEVTGEASVLNSLAFQEEVLKTEPLFIGAEFTQVTVTSAPPKDDDTGVVDGDSYETTIPFWLGKTLDMSLVQYQPSQVIEELLTTEEGSEETVVQETSQLPEDGFDGVDN